MGIGEEQYSEKNCADLSYKYNKSPHSRRVSITGTATTGIQKCLKPLIQVFTSQLRGAKGQIASYSACFPAQSNCLDESLLFL